MSSTKLPLKVTLLMVSSLTIMSMITISASLPDMAADFSEVPYGALLVKLSLSFPALFIALSAIVAGLLIDRAGRLKLLGWALLLYAIAGTSGYWLENLYLILLGRAVLGICVGFTMTIATTLIADYFQGRERQGFAGLQIAVMSVAGILFITLGGYLAESDWRLPFLLYASALFIIPFALHYLKEPTVVQERNHSTPTVNPPPVIWLVFANVMLMWILFFIIPIQIPFYLKDIGIEQNSLIGIAIAASTLFSAVGSISFSRLKDRLSYRQIFMAGYALMALAYLVIALGSTYVSVLTAMLLAGLGMGIMIPNANIWVMELAPPATRGREIGRLTTFWFVGQFLSPLILLPFLEFFQHSAMFLGLAMILFSFCLFFMVSHWRLSTRVSTP